MNRTISHCNSTSPDGCVLISLGSEFMDYVDKRAEQEIRANKAAAEKRDQQAAASHRSEVRSRKGER